MKKAILIILALIIIGIGIFFLLGPDTMGPEKDRGFLSKEKEGPEVGMRKKPKTEFSPSGKGRAPLPTNQQTTFPAPTDIFIFCPGGAPDQKFIPQTHASIIGVGAALATGSGPDYEEFYRGETARVHKLGLKYTVWLSTYDIDVGGRTTPEKFYQDRPELLEAACIDIDGKKMMFELERLPWQCTNNPVWREFLLKAAKRSIDWVADGFTFDEWLGSASVSSPDFNGCFCEHCMKGFREYLKQKYSLGELQSLGIGDIIDNFDYGDFIREGHLATYRASRWQVPLFSDFEDYQMLSIKKFWHEFVSEIREYGAAQGKDIYFSANTPELYPVWIPIQNELDYLSPEFTYDIPPKGKSITASKIARSLGKPAFFTPICTGITTEIMTRPDATALMKIYTVEAYSARGFLIVPYHIWFWTSPGEGESYYADIEELSPYYDFIYNNKPYYENLFSTSKIAVLYSYPSARQAYDSFTNAFYGISDLLLHSNFQYDVLFAGDDNWIKNSLSLAQLKEYEVIILPSTSNLLDQQVDLLLSYSEAGGNIVAFGQTEPRLRSFVHNKNILSGISNMLKNLIPRFGKGFEYSGNIPSAKKISSILNDLIQPNIQTNANENVVMLEYWNNETRSIIIHLINYNYNIKTKHLNIQKNINLEVMLNPELLGKNLIISYKSPDGAEIKELDYLISNGNIKFQIPNLEFYGVISIEEAEN